MSLSRVPEIPRAFAEWGTEQVVQWLETLQLSRDYAKQFRDHNIDGPALLRLNPSSLSSLGITDSLDRVKLLQQITTMQADLASSLAAPTRRWRGLGKFRRYSDNTPVYRTLTAPPSRRVSTEEGKPRGSMSASRTLYRPTVLDGYSSQQNRMRTQSVHSFSGTNSSTSGTLYSVADTNSSVIGTSHSDIGVPRSESALAHSLSRMAYSDIGHSPTRNTEGRGETPGVLLRRRSSRSDKKKRLSRSMDKLWEAQLAGSPLPLVADSHSVPRRGMSRYHSAGVPFHDSLAHQESVSVRLHDGPHHRATASVQLHDSVPYDDGTMRLHENSRLLEILHEENATLKRELETYYQRVCKLMRMEQELERLREAHRLLEESNRRREKLEAAMRSKLEGEIARLRAEASDGSVETLLERRDSVAKRKFQRDNSGDQPQVSDIHVRAQTDDTEVYSQRIDRLNQHLQSLQLVSLKREELERRVRIQLQDEIRELRGREGGAKEEGKGEEEGGATNWETEVAVLQADLAKWEQKCTELAAEKELAVEVALAQKENYISQLKTALAGKEEEVRELMERTQRCSCQFNEVARQISHASPLHKVHSSPSHKSPPHTSPSHHAPHHQLHTSPTSQLSPSHRKTTSPTPTYVSHTHKLHHSPPHQLHTSPTKKTGSMLDLSRGSSTSPSSSLINESHSDAHVHRSPHAVPFLINGGGDPTIIATSAGGGQGELAQAKLSSLPPDVYHSITEQSNDAPLNNPRHVVRRVKSKTPPPRSEVNVLPQSYKYSSLERGPPVSHTPLELQLFNTLLGDAVPGGPAGDRGVNSSGKHSLKGVNTLYSHPHGNRV